MKLQIFFASVFIVGALFGSPVTGLAEDYCYLGSIVDDTTGEILDMYGLCAENSEETLELT